MFGGCDALLHVIDITKGEREKVINANSYIIVNMTWNDTFVARTREHTSREKP